MTGGSGDPPAQMLQSQPQRQEGEGFLRMASRWFLMFSAIQLFLSGLTKTGIIPGAVSHQKKGQHGVSTTGHSGQIPRGVEVDPKLLTRPTCLWSAGTTMDLHVYFSDEEELPVDGTDGYGDSEGLALAEWHELDLRPYDKGDPSRRSANVTVPLSDSIRWNETQMYAHVRLVRRSDGRDQSSADILAKRINVTKHKLRKKIRDERSLLGDDSRGGDFPNDASNADLHADDNSPLSLAAKNRTHDKILLYGKPSLTLQFVDMGATPHFTSREAIPANFGDHLDWLDDESNGYFPIVYSSEFWISKDSLLPINGTSRDMTVEVAVEPISMIKWQFMSSMEESWRQQERMTGDEDSGGSDTLRTMLLETNPILLALTAIISVLHTIFDMLAFKNDITFYKGRKSMEGLSIRSMMINVGFQLVILAYLADNETSMMVLFSNGMSLAIELWKISKALTVSISGGRLQWEETKAYSKSKTKEYDEIATTHLSYVTLPLVAGYAVYSLLHQKHRGWYSWILNTGVGFIYMFGFVNMTPQLFINYKLKSVAHLNFRTMTYKSINTFIDDLFAFVIKMPIMHRMACLRDDLIFFIFLYQRRIYRTDYSRVNEFGQCVEPTEDMLKDLKREEGAPSAGSASEGEEGPPGTDGSGSAPAEARRVRGKRTKQR